MKLNDKVYDILKWVTMVVIPALTAAYVGLGAVQQGGFSWRRPVR